jgi:hypothetical protein
MRVLTAREHLTKTGDNNMKKLTLSLCAAVAMATAAYAGTETYSKSVAPPPCPEWYADNEFNLTLSGVWAPTGNDWADDTYLVADHGWGGSIDAKYFIHRYFGFGIQGNLIHVNSHTFEDNGFTRSVIAHEDRWIGSVLGTINFRFPISCSRWAPYAWIGGGGIFGGGQDHQFFLEPTAPLGIVDRTFPDEKTKVLGQVGGGFEVRFTPHCGWTNDFSWNVVSGTNNNFGMARTGINFAF